MCGGQGRVVTVGGKAEDTNHLSSSFLAEVIVPQNQECTSGEVVPQHLT